MQDLRPLHPEEKPNAGKTGPIIATVVVALGLIAIGGYTYHSGMWSHGQAVSDNQLPQPLPLPAKS